MTPEKKMEVNNQAAGELMDLSDELAAYRRSNLGKADFGLTQANELDLGALQRVRKLIADEIGRR